MSFALTRQPSPALVDCQLTHLERQPIDYNQALEQHRLYSLALQESGLDVSVLPALPSLPDSPFVEDCALILDETAVLTSMGTEARREEVELLAPEIACRRPVLRVERPALLEGGDVLRVGKRLLVGVSARTNLAGVRALQDLLAPFGYQVLPVAVSGCLHLKTGCTALDDETLLLNPAWVDSAALQGFRLVPVLEQEPWAANVLRLPDGELLANTAYPQTLGRIERLGFRLKTVDISEFGKVEGGLTCLSLIFS